MCQKVPLIVMLFPAFNFASLLPLRNKPAVSTDVYPSRPRLVSSKVVNTGIAVALVDNEDGLIVENIRLSNPAPTPMSAILADVLRPHKTDGKVTKSSVAVKSVDNEDGTLIDYYTQYDGNGSTADGWPSRKSWVSFADMFNNSKYIFERSCKLYHQKANSHDETTDVYDAIQLVANRTLVDHRFILAIMMQESGGCVRAPTSDYGVPNPGMMQDHNGTATCNNGTRGGVQNPCPRDMIKRMIQDGTGGTDWGDGLAQCINDAETDDVSAFYRAARIYNSGSIDESGNLEDGIATHCYASDIANRLTGWVTYEHDCTLDDGDTTH